MTNYLQTNELGYVVGVTTEPVLSGLFGGSPKDFRKLSDTEAENIRTLLTAHSARGEGLHIDELVEFKK